MGHTALKHRQGEHGAHATTMAQRTAEVPQMPSMAEFDDVHIELQRQV